MKHAFFIQMMVLSIVLVLAMTGCGSEPAAQPSIDVDATVAAQVQSTLAANQPPTLAPTIPVPTVDVDATVEAAVQMTVEAQPTPTAEPTNTPVPTPTPEPTWTPTPVPSPTPDSRMFWDDFETGSRPEWNFLGNSYSITNGKLVANEPIEGFIGDNSWENYILLLNEFTYSGGIQYLIRVQDRDNYMMLDCKGVGSDWGKNHCYWYTVIDGKAVEIPGTHFVNAGCGGCGPGGGNPFRLEVEGNTYRTFINGEQILYFVNDTFQSGGIGLRSVGELAIGSVEVGAIP